MNGIVLAGGKSSRFGENKAFTKFEDRPLIERIVSSLGQIFSRIYVATNSPADYHGLDAQVVVDIYKNCGPLGGIHAGLLSSSSFSNFVVACDAPFLNLELIQYLIKVQDKFDLIIPKFADRFHPLFAVYTKACLPPIEKQLKSGDLRLTNLIGVVNSKIIKEEEIKRFDPQGLSFTNINSRQDYEQL